MESVSPDETRVPGATAYPFLVRIQEQDCGLGLAAGWAGFHLLLRTGLPAALFEAGTRYVPGEQIGFEVE